MQKIIENILSDSFKNAGYEIVQISYYVSGGSSASDKKAKSKKDSINNKQNNKIGNLQILIEKLDRTPVNIDDCGNASNIASLLLDVEDVIANQYNLEVSSAGIDRPLVKIEDYQRFIGEEARIELKWPIQQNISGNIVDRKKFRGQIEKVEQGDNGYQIFIVENDAAQTQNDELIAIAFNNIIKAKLLRSHKLKINN